MGGWHNTARRRRGRRAGRGERLGLTRDCPTHFVSGDSDRGLVTSAVRRAHARARARRFAGCRGDRAVAMVARVIRVTSAGELHVPPEAAAWLSENDFGMPYVATASSGSGAGEGGGGGADTNCGALASGVISFEARAASDATVLLAQKPGATHYRHNCDMGEHYTAIFGSHRNSKFVLERNGKVEVALSELPEHACMDATDFKKYWLGIDAGVLSAGWGPQPGDNKFFEWRDPRPLTRVRHVGLTTWDTPVSYRAIDVRGADGTCGGQESGPQPVHDDGGAEHADERACRRAQDTWATAGQSGLPGDFLGLSELTDCAVVRGATGLQERAVMVHAAIVAAALPALAQARPPAGWIVDRESSGRLLIYPPPGSPWGAVDALLRLAYAHAVVKVPVGELDCLASLAQQCGSGAMVDSVFRAKVGPSTKGEPSVQVSLHCGKRLFADVAPGCRCLMTAPPAMSPFDVLIETDDGGESIPAHRALLAMHSPYFCSVFRDCWREALPPGTGSPKRLCVVKSAFTRSAVAAAVRFIYEGSDWQALLDVEGEMRDINDELSALCDVLLVADYYGMHDLSTSAAERALEYVRPDNVCSVLVALEGLLSCKTLRLRLERYVARRIRLVTAVDPQGLADLPPHVIEAVLKDERRLPATAEDSVFDALASWAGDDVDRARFADASNLVAAVRYASLSEECMQRAMASKLAKSSECMRSCMDRGIAARAGCGTADQVQKNGSCFISRCNLVPSREPRRAGIVLRFQHAGDNAGVVGLLGTRRRIGQSTKDVVRPFVSPAVSGHIRVSSSSPCTSMSSAAALVKRGAPKRFNSFRGNASEGGRAWCQLDLGSSGKLVPNYYTLRHDASSDFLRCWTLEASSDGTRWRVLSAHAGEGPASKHEWKGWPINGAASKHSYSHFRIVLGEGPGATASGEQVLALSELELYGLFVSTYDDAPPPEPDDNDREAADLRS